jgi:DNA processing protein
MQSIAIQQRMQRIDSSRHARVARSEGTSTVTADQAALVALLKTRPKKLTWRKLTDQIVTSGSASAVWNLYNPDELIPPQEANGALTEAEADLKKWDREGLKFVTALDPKFPRRLLEIADTPPFLFAQGNVRVDDPAIAIVDSRKVIREDEGLGHLLQKMWLLKLNVHE